jgi:hypothetical protein
MAGLSLRRRSAQKAVSIEDRLLFGPSATGGHIFGGEIDWTHQGLPSDMDEWGKERESDDRECWPYLEYFSVDIIRGDFKVYRDVGKFLQEVRSQTTVHFTIRPLTRR